MEPNKPEGELKVLGRQITKEQIAKFEWGVFCKVSPNTAQICKDTLSQDNNLS